MEKSIPRQINLLTRKIQIYLGGTLAKYELTAAEQPFFLAVQRWEGMTQEELTAVVCVDKAVTTRVVQSLEKKGYFKRVQDQQDRRKNLIYPTETAKKQVAAVRSELHSFDRQLTAGIEEETLEMVYEALLRMEQNLMEMDRNKNRRMGKQKGESENGGTTDAD